MLRFLFLQFIFFMLRFKLFVKINFLLRLNNICNHGNGFNNFALIMALIYTFILFSTLDNLQNIQLEFIRLYFCLKRIFK